MMGSGKKVLIFGSYAPSLVNFRGKLIEAMSKRGHQVIAVAPGMDVATADAIRKLGGEPQEIQVTNQSLNPVPMWRALGQVRQILRQHRPDVLIAYTIKPVVLGGIAAGAEKVPKVIALITGAGYAFTDVPGWRHRITRAAATLLYKAGLRHVHWVIFQNPDDEDLFRRLGMIGRRQQVCRINGSGVDLTEFAPAPLPSRPSFLMVARLIKGKGVREYGAAAARLKARYPEIRAHLVGYIDASPDAISEAELQQVIDGGVQFHGRLDDVRPAIAKASVFVLPSRYREGTPRSVLEAMAMGRAIVTLDAPGCRETVRDGVNGYLVPPGNAEALYETMERFVLNPALASAMGEQSRLLAQSKFDVEQVNADLLKIAEL